MTAAGTGLCIAAGLTVAAAVIIAAERARARRGLADWWDIPVFGFGVYLGALALVGWCWLLAGAVAR
jgi:hypothetical protein